VIKRDHPFVPIYLFGERSSFYFYIKKTLGLQVIFLISSLIGMTGQFGHPFFC
jgi:hypothetical protein